MTAPVRTVHSFGSAGADSFGSDGAASLDSSGDDSFGGGDAVLYLSSDGSTDDESFGGGGVRAVWNDSAIDDCFDKDGAVSFGSGEADSSGAGGAVSFDSAVHSGGADSFGSDGAVSFSVVDSLAELERPLLERRLMERRFNGFVSTETR